MAHIRLTIYKHFLLERQFGNIIIFCLLAFFLIFCFVSIPTLLGCRYSHLTCFFFRYRYQHVIPLDFMSIKEFIFHWVVFFFPIPFKWEAEIISSHHISVGEDKIESFICNIESKGNERLYENNTYDYGYHFLPWALFV